MKRFVKSIVNQTLYNTNIKLYAYSTRIIKLKPQGNRPLYSNTVIGTLAVDRWAVTFGTARRGLGGAAPRSSLLAVYQM